MKKGFTLIETLVALSVFLTGFLAVVVLGSQSQLLSRTSAVRTRAALLAQEGVETAIAAGYNELPTDIPFLDEPTLDYLGEDYAGFSRLVTVQYVDENLNIVADDYGMKLIAVTINWDTTTGDASTIAKTYSMSSILTDL